MSQKNGSEDSKVSTESQPRERNRPGTQGVVSAKKEREGNKMFSISPGAKWLLLWSWDFLGILQHNAREEGKEQRAAPAERTHPKAEGPEGPPAALWELGLGALHQGGHGLRPQRSEKAAFTPAFLPRGNHSGGCAAPTWWKTNP